MPRPSQAPLITEYSSASAELLAMTDCVFDHTFTQCSPRSITPPDVLFRLRLHPAQSESVKTEISVGSGWRSNFHTSLGLFLKYFAILIILLHDPVVGLDISRHPSLIA